MKNTIVLIPARSGSKSIPKKNLQLLKGKPLIAHTIELALQLMHIQQVIVSTDSEEIAEIALSYGARVPFLRPANLSGDDALDIGFHLHALDMLRKSGVEIEAIVNLRPTHPFRSLHIVQNAVNMFFSLKHYDSLRSVRIAEQSPYKMWHITQDQLKPVLGTFKDEFYNQPRQKLPQVFWQDGYVDIVWARTLVDKQSTTGDVIFPFLVNHDSIDIDYPEDLAAAESYTFNQDTSAIYEGRPQKYRDPS